MSDPVLRKPWPFLSADSRVNEQAQADMPEEDEPDDGKCRCVMAPGETALTGRELMTGRCRDCGRRFV